MKIVKIIIPSIEELGRDIERNLKCPEKDCDRVFQHQPALKMHMVKVHKILQEEKDINIHSGKKNKTDHIFDFHYHCPLQSCKYSSALGNFFSKLSYLRQHYMKVHGEKKYSCSKCGNGFSLERLRRQHELKCNPKYRCSKCQELFLQKSSLHEHCNITRHPFLFDMKDELRKSADSTKSSDICNRDIEQSVSKQEMKDSKSDEHLEKTPVQSDIPSDSSKYDRAEKDDIVGENENDSKDVNATIDSTISNTSESVRDSNCCIESSRNKSPHIPLSKNLETHYVVEDIVEKSCPIQDIKLNHKLNDSNKCSDNSAISLLDDESKVNFIADTPLLTNNFRQASTEKSEKSRNKKNTENVLNHNKQNDFYEKLPIETSTASVTLLTPLEKKNYQNNDNKVNSKYILPKLLPQPVCFIYSPYFISPIPVNPNVVTVPKQRAILPKHTLLSLDLKCDQSSMRNTQIQDINRDTDLQSESALSRKIITKRASSATQTGSLKKKPRKVAETQTAGDYILKRAMMSAKLPVVKESRGSQVSPRAKLKRTWQQVQTSETQTLGSSKQYFARKKKRKFTPKCDFSTNTNFSPPPSIETQTGVFIDDVLAKPEQAHVSVHSQSEDIVTAVNNVQVRLLESSSTQTFDSYLASGSITDNQFSNTQDSEMQTKLSMNMSLEACDTKDLQSLEQLGYLTQNLTDTANSLFIPRKSNRGKEIGVSMMSTSNSAQTLQSFNPALSPIETQNSHNLPSIAQTDTVINNQIAEFVDDLQPSNRFNSHDPMFSLEDTSSSGLIKMISDSDSNSDKISCLSNNGHLTVTSVQTSADDFDLPMFLSTEVQTTNFDSNFSSSIETQTTNEDVINDLLNMQTQTNDDLWAELGLSDIQTQTSDLNLCSPGQVAVNVETQTSQANTFCRNINSQSVETQASLINITSSNSHVDSADIETQTLFDNLTDSHTQTSWKDLMKIVHADHY